MAKQFDFTEHGASVILDRDDAQEILAEMSEGEVVEISTMTFQAGKRLAHALLERGWKIKRDDQEEEEAPKAKKAKKPRDPSAPPKLTKKRVEELRAEYDFLVSDANTGGALTSSSALLSLSSSYHYDVKKLRKALGITEG